MIPILYEADEQDFTSNGLGRLSDTVACNVEEERNGSYELTMTYPITGIHFEDICLSRFVYAVPADGKSGQPFRIYHISKPINGIVEIHAEHISYQLSHIPVSPFTTTTIGGALSGLVDYSAETNPFTFWTDKTTVANFSVDIPTSCRALLGGMEGSILDTFGGGEYEFDMYAVNLYQNRGQDRGVTLRYGKNITDIKQEENITNTYTGVYPYWKGNGGNSEEVIFTLPEKVLHSASASNFPYQRTIPLDLSSEWENKPTEAQLRSRANAYMVANKIGVPSVSIDVSFVTLWQTEEYSSFANLERVNLCDTVTVYFSKLGISAQAKVVKTNYNVLKERYDSIELGDAKSNFASQIKADISATYADVVDNFPSKSFLQLSVERATKLITGGLGGYVVMTPNADGEPQEILIMDTDDIQTAVNVIRINRNGIGFSTNGYEGPFVSAWTIDGHFVADFIDTGNLNASLITTGTMSADRIHGGTLTLGGHSGEYGSLELYNESNVRTAYINYEGMTFENGGIYVVSSDQSYYRLLSFGLGTFNPYNGNTFQSEMVYIANGAASSTDRGEMRMGVSPSSTNAYSAIIDTNKCLELQSYRNDSTKTTRLILESNQVRITDSDSQGYNTRIDGGEIYTQDLNVDNIRSRSGGSSGEVEFDGDVRIMDALVVGGNFTSQGTKHRLVETDNYGNRLLYCYEMPNPIFGDIGQGVLDENGICFVEIDDVFRETVRSDIEYQVFLQAEGVGELYVHKKEPTYFVVKGSANLPFAWEIKAKQKDYESLRLENNDERDAFKFDLNNIIEKLEKEYYEEVRGCIDKTEESLYETT